MADQIVFPIEEIPDDDSVFMRAHRTRMRDGAPRASAFEPHGGSMSVDWDKYSTACDTRARGKKPEDNAVVQMVVSAIRNENLGVNHAPELDNQAHTDVMLPADNGEQTEARLKLSRLATVVVPLDS